MPAKKTKSPNATTPTATPTPSPTATPLDLTSAAAHVATLLDQISNALPFDDPSAKDAQAAIVANRVPPAAITIAAKILEANPQRFPDLDPTVTRSALAYDQALSPLVLQLAQLQQRTAKTVLHRRGQGATQTLALYQILKGLSRVSMNKATLVQQKQLEKLIRTSHKVRATTVTKKELKVAKSGMTASKKSKSKAAAAAAANAEAQQAAATEAVVLAATGGATAQAATPPQAPPAPAPSPAPATVPVTPSH
jgi:hypothetical protein